MGFWKGLAKSGVGTLNGIGSATIGLTKGATIASRNTVGKALFNTVTSNPGKVGAAVAIGAAAGAIGGDIAKEDTKKTETKESIADVVKKEVKPAKKTTKK